MKNIKRFLYPVSFSFLVITGYAGNDANAQIKENGETKLDKQVREFLNNNKNKWSDWNVPFSDGQLLYDIIVKNNYKNAIEIGTSTGHSGIWIAWALSKTGGKLTTFEIDEKRHNEALANFEKAGVSAYIDARLGDAHQLVPAIKGPVDFVFSDADKSWYINYFKDLESKLTVGGCFVSHNVSLTENADYYNYVNKLPNYKTTLDTKGAGVAISYKTK